MPPSATGVLYPSHSATAFPSLFSLTPDGADGGGVLVGVPSPHCHASGVANGTVKVAVPVCASLHPP